jgi:hypothetical protein
MQKRAIVAKAKASEDLEQKREDLKAKFASNYSPRTKSQKKLDRFLGVKNRNCRVMA